MTRTIGARRSAVCTLAIATLASGAAEAVMLEPGGLGQVLLFPYYTTRGGNDTLISIVNTAAHGKALKLRFLEGRNGRPVLDFHLYLGAFDVWTAAVGHLRGAAGDQLGSGLLTRDRSCTVPDIVRGGLGYEYEELHLLPDGVTYFVSFSNAAFSGIAQDHDDDVAAELGSLNRTRDGHIELIEMAEIISGSELGAWITHNASGTPGNCALLNRAWFEADGAFALDSTFGLQAPTGSGHLFGNAMIVHPARGTVIGYAADAISDFSHRILHDVPGGREPGLHSVNDPGPGGETRATARIARAGRFIEVTYEDDMAFGKVDAISALYATPSVINEFYLDQEIVVGASEWVLTFPTRRYYVDSKPALPHGEPFVPAASVRAPFSVSFENEGACSPVQTTFFDRAQRSPGSAGFPIQPPRPLPRTCWQTQLLTFGQFENFLAGEASEILGAMNYLEARPPYGLPLGWARVRFANEPAMRPSTQGVIIQGLPVTGFFVINYDNQNLDGGVLANYSAAFRHRADLSCIGSASCQESGR